MFTKPTQIERFRNLLTDFDTAILITHSQENHSRARPMLIARVDDNCDLWFLTDNDSANVHEIEADTHVRVVCQNGRASCVSITGRAEPSRDRVRIRQLWRLAYQVWFPRGADDPNIVLIHVIGELGEYWDHTGINRITYAYQPIKVVATRATPEIKEGDQQGHLELAHGRLAVPNSADGRA